MMYGREISLPIDMQFYMGSPTGIPDCTAAYAESSPEWLRDSLR